MKEKKYGLDLTEGRISTLLLRFAWPFLAAALISALYGVIDLFVIGQYCNDATLSGVSTGTQILNLVYTATISVGTGGTVLVGRKIGEKDAPGCARAAGTFMTVGLALAVVVTALIGGFREPLLSLLQTPELARPSATNYVIFTTLGIPFNVGFSTISAIARGMGNSRTPSVIGAIGCGVNIVLDFLFVGAFHMAEVGVAVATAAAQLSTFVIIGLWLLKIKFPFPFSKKNFKIDFGSVKSIFKVSLPLWLQELLVSVSFMIIAALVNSMGVVASASVGIIAKVFNLGGIFPLAIGNAIAAMAAQNLGAGRRDRALKALGWGVAYSLIIDVAFCIYCQIAPETITAAFATQEPVIAGAAAYLRSFSIDLVFVALIFCTNAYLNGCGKSLVTMIHSLAATFGLRVPLSIVFAGLTGLTLNTQLYYLGFAAPIASVLSIVICLAYIYRQEKAHRKLSVPSEEGV